MDLQKIASDKKNLFILLEVNKNKDIEEYFEQNYKIDKFNKNTLKKCIDILFTKYKKYANFKYFDKVKLLKDKNLKKKFIKGVYDPHFINTELLDLAILKEIQIEYNNKISNNKNKEKVKEKKIEIIKEEIEEIKYNKTEANFYPKKIKLENNIEFYIKKLKGLLIWIDTNIETEENQYYIKLLKSNKYLKLKYYNNVNEAFNFILQEQPKIIYIIVSGRDYPNYFHKLNENIKKIKILPICCIFTSEYMKQKYIHKEVNYEYGINEDVLLSINHPFYNKGSINTHLDSCIKFFLNYQSFFPIDNSTFINENNNNIKNDIRLTFDLITSRNQLIMPFLFHKNMEKKEIRNIEIINFYNYIFNKYNENVIKQLIKPLLYIKWDIPIEIISKFFARMYTEETQFYKEMNKSLQEKNVTNYKTYIEIMYNGLFLKSLHRTNELELFRGTKMSRKELDEIKKNFEEWKNNPNKKLPKYLLYARSFMSFTKDKNKYKQFVGETNNEFYGVIIELKYSKDIIKKYSSNVDIESISKFPEEKEVIFYPYTTFCLQNIDENKYKNKKWINIEIGYLGKYEVVYEEFEKDKNFQKSFVGSLFSDACNYNNDIIDSNLLVEDDIKNLKKNDKILKLVLSFFL